MLWSAVRTLLPSSTGLVRVDWSPSLPGVHRAGAIAPAARLRRVKWSTAIRNLRELAQATNDLAASPAAKYALPVTQLWAAQEILGTPRDLEWVTAAVVVDLPVEDVPWLVKPNGSEHWENFTRAAKHPIVTLWRSAQAPVWNHYLSRPALFWDRRTGLDEDALQALSEGRGEEVRISAPAPDEFRARLEDDLAVSLGALRERTRAYEDRRWSQGKFTAVADELWEASNGYVDLLDGLAS